jgi:hypothetical protein
MTHRIYCKGGRSVIVTARRPKAKALAIRMALGGAHDMIIRQALQMTSGGFSNLKTAIMADIKNTGLAQK